MPIVRTIRPPGALCCAPNTCSIRARNPALGVVRSLSGAASPQLVVLVTTVPLRRHRHDTGVDDLPATRDVALRRKMLVKTLKQLFNQPGLGQLLAEQPERRGVRNTVLDPKPQKARERQPVAHLIFHLLVR